MEREGICRNFYLTAMSAALTLNFFKMHKDAVKLLNDFPQMISHVNCMLQENLMTKPVYLAFDIDGTIYDAGNILEEAFAEAVASLVKSGDYGDIKAPSREAITATLGYPLEKICLMLFPEQGEEARSYLSLRWTENLVSLIRQKKGELIAGVEETIPLLYNYGYRMLVASNGAMAYVEAILETYDLKRYFSNPFLYAEGEIRNKTDIVARYLKELDYDKIIMIGDRLTDLDAARMNNIPFIGCAFGHAGGDEIAGEKYIIHDFREMEGVIKMILDE